jgi:hypothetical protein
MGGRLRVVFNLCMLTLVHFVLVLLLDRWGGQRGRVAYRSQARLAHAKVRPISSSALRLLILFRDCASRELASSISSGGSGPARRGISSLRAFSTGLLIFCACMLLLTNPVTVERERDQWRISGELQVP